MASKFLTNIELNAGLVDVNGNTGTSGQILSSTGSGVDWVSLSEISGVDGTGTANYVAKWSDVDTITNSVIYDNGTNVGIGTTSPGARLEVKSAAPNTFFADFISSTGSGFVNIYENSNSHPLLYMADATGTTTVVLNSSGVSYLISGNIIIGGTADNGNLLQVQGTGYFDGNVGIGTVNPSSKLDISGAVKIDTDGTYGSEYGMVGFGGTTDGYNRIFGRTTTADGLFLASATGRGIFFRANGGNTDHMVVIASGNVGIGTTSPGYKLDVSGTGRFTDTLTVQGTGNSSFAGNVGINITTPQTGLHLYDTTANATAGGTDKSILRLTNTYAGAFGSGGEIQFGLHPSTSGTSVLSAIKGKYTEYTSGNYGGDLSFYTRNDDGLGLFERMTIDANGNVGIGTTSPTAKLTIGGLGIGNIGGLKIEESSSAADGAHFSYNDASRYVVFGGITNNVLNDAVAIERDATRTITINSLQRVGIGTTSPSYKLDVSGTGRFTDTLTVQGTGNSSFAGNIILNTNATYLYGELLAGTQTRIHGINASNLEWVGSIDALVAGTNIGNNTSYINLRTGNTDRVRVDSSGNVGIGTTSPSYKLDVSGTGRFTGTTLFQSQLTVAESSGDSVLEVGNSGIGGNHRINIIAAGSGQDAGYYISGTPRVYTNTGNTSITRINAPSTGIIQFETNLTERVRINNGGNVSIGNTNNTYRLDVSGTGRFTSDLTVQGTGDSSFAGNVGIGTTSPSEKLEVNGTIKATDYKGYLTTFQHGGFQHTASTSSTTVYWIPTNSISEVISSQSYNNWVAPYDGRVKKIIMRWTGAGSSPTATSVTFRKAINLVTDVTLYPATVTSPATTDMIVERDFSSTDISFQAGDRVQVGFTTDGGTRLLQGFAYTIELEYNKI